MPGCFLPSLATTWTQELNTLRPKEPQGEPSVQRGSQLWFCLVLHFIFI